MVLGYILKQSFHEVVCFFRRWYLERSELFWAKVFENLSLLDRGFAVAINARLVFQPLWGDYSVVGRILGPILRSFRVLLGSFIYFWILLFAGIIWLLWILFLPFCLLLIFS